MFRKCPLKKLLLALKSVKNLKNKGQKNEKENHGFYREPLFCGSRGYGTGCWFISSSIKECKN
jgi:hypothetical protein